MTRFGVSSLTAITFGVQPFILICWNGRGRAFDKIVEKLLAHGTSNITEQNKMSPVGSFWRYAPTGILSVFDRSVITVMKLPSFNYQ